MKFETQYGIINITPVNEHRLVASTDDDAPITVNGIECDIKRLYLTDEVVGHRKQEDQKWYIDFSPYSAGVYRHGTVMRDVTDNARRKVYAEVEKLADQVPQDAISGADHEFREARAKSLRERAERFKEAATAAHELADAVLFDGIPLEKAEEIADRWLPSSYVSDKVLKNMEIELARERNAIR